MRVLAFRHVPFEDLGLIAPVLAERRIDVDYADLYQAGAAMPDIAAYDALIFLGGPMSVNDDLPYLGSEMELIRQAVARRQPILGICLGAQLIARALGATVRRNSAKEIGWYDLRFTEAAAADRLFHGLSDGNRLPLARRDLRPAARRGTAGVVGPVPQSGVPRR